MPNTRWKVVVNEPTPGAPTDKQMAATVQSVAEQGGCTLQPPGQEVLVGRFAEGRLELSTEVGRGQARDSGQVGHGKRLEVPGVCEVFGSEQMAGDRGGWHGADSAGSHRPTPTTAASRRRRCATRNPTVCPSSRGKSLAVIESAP